MNRIFLAIGFALLLTSPLLAEQFSQLQDATPQKILGGPVNLGILKTPARVAIYRVAADYDAHDGKFVTIDGQKCRWPEQTVSAADTAKVIEAITDSGNFGSALLCDFDPGIILRFQNKTGILDIVVCFHCGEMAVYRDGEEVHRDIKFAGSTNTFRHVVHVAFVTIAKDAFPNDPEIMALP